MKNQSLDLKQIKQLQSMMMLLIVSIKNYWYNNKKYYCRFLFFIFAKLLNFDGSARTKLSFMLNIFSTNWNNFRRSLFVTIEQNISLPCKIFFINLHRVDDCWEVMIFVISKDQFTRWWLCISRDIKIVDICFNICRIADKMIHLKCYK